MNAAQFGGPAPRLAPGRLTGLAVGTALGVLLSVGSGRLPRRSGGRARLVIADRGLASLVLTRRGYVVITLGRVVVATRPLSPAERRHESAHLAQSEELGWKFLPLYLYYHFRHGYAANPLEVAARAAEADGPDRLPAP